MNPVHLADTSSRVFYEFAPLMPVSEWWHFFILLLLLLAGISFVVLMYWLDSVELSLPLSLLLMFLRVAAIAGLVFFFLNLEKRSEQRIVRNSRVAVLIDTSASMGLDDAVLTEANNNALSGTEGSGSLSRIDQVVDWLDNTEALNDIRSQHDVTVYTFADTKTAKEIVSLPRLNRNSAVDDESKSDGQVAGATSRAQISELADFKRAQTWFVVGVSLLAISLVLNLLSGLMRLMFAGSLTGTWMFSIGIVILVGSIILIAASDVMCVSADLMQTAGLREYGLKTDQPDVPKAGDESESPPEEQVDWSELVEANGASTYLNDALRNVINKERDGPIAGVVLISDGRNTSGANYQVSIAAARDAAVPVFAIGAGSNQSPSNIRVVDLKAPTRVFPGDKFKVTALIQSQGFQQQDLTVELYSVDQERTEAETNEANGTLITPTDGKPAPITFELQQPTEGTRLYTVRVTPLPRESNVQDNEETVPIEFIDRKQHVLLIAGGPARDYRFLRNFLYRDPQFISHVFLQTAVEGADQEADETIFTFPKSREEWFNMDCIVAFDPDWETLSSQQAKWLEEWVAEKAGGLIVIAGPVNTPRWTRRPRGDETIDIIRRLYPVSFYSQTTSVVKLGRFGGERAYPLEFSRAGRASEFLWLAETGSASQDVWAESKGVFGYYSVSEPKPGAEVFARFSDEQTRIAGNLPIYLAGHFYGAGRVYFQASGEMWRMRSMDPLFFDQYYSKLIRWVSQGRLSRDSNRGLLLVDQDKVWIGDRITVQAILRDAQDRPLALSSVTAAVKTPSGIGKRLELKRIDDGTNSGTYSAQLAAVEQGKYRITLPIPESPDAEVLTKTVTATISDIEIGQPERNDAVLQEMADQTGGVYFTSINDVPVSIAPDNKQNAPGIEHIGLRIASKDQETFLPGSNDQEFTRRCMMWLLGLFVLVLSMEWTIRRLNRLA